MNYQKIIEVTHEAVYTDLLLTLKQAEYHLSKQDIVRALKQVLHPEEIEAIKKEL